MSNNGSKLKFIDIFAGAGGLSHGLEMAGLECILGVEKDKFAAETFRLNHKKAAIFDADIEMLTESKLLSLLNGNKVDVVVGGPPCQGFSTVGLGNPKDKRNFLFKEFIRIVKITQPKFFVIENVTGILAKKNEKTIQAIVHFFNQMGYQLDIQVMSADHFGVPERRRRTIFLGSRINASITFPKAIFNTNIKTNRGEQFIPPVTVGDALKDLCDEKGKIHNHDLDLAQIKNELDLKRLKYIPEGKGIRYEKDEVKYLPKKLRYGIDWEKLPEGRFRQMKYQRLDRNSVSPTIMTHRQNYYHPTEHRYLTQREAAALQSFPNHFIFKGPMSSQWRQIGNAVPPLLGKAIGRAILQMYRESNLVQKNQLKKNQLQRIKKNEVGQKRSKAFNYKKELAL